MMIRRIGIGCALLCALAGEALAQAGATGSAVSWPTRPVHWIVPYPAGGAADLVTRLVVGNIGGALGQPIVVEYRPGASGTIGAAAVAKAAPDGYTFLFSDVGVLVHNTALFRSLPFDPVKDLVPVGLFGRTPIMLIAGPGESARTLQEFVARAKAATGAARLNIAAPAAGAHHFALEVFKLRTGVDAQTVPYQSAAQAVQAVLGGQLPALMTDPSMVMPAVRAGKLRVLGVAAGARMPELQDVPTFSESVAPGLEVYAWAGLTAPMGTPQPAIQRMNAEIQKALNAPELVRRFGEFGLQTRPGTPEEMGALWKAELAIWPEVIRKLGLTSE